MRITGVTIEGGDEERPMLIGFRTATSDWLAWETARQPLETAIPAF